MQPLPASVFSPVNEPVLRLLKACRDGDEASVARLIGEGADIDASALVEPLPGVGLEDNTPLRIASLHGNASIVSRLIACGADVNKPTREGSTALMSASFRGHFHVVRLLLAAAADPNAGKDWSPLHAACSGGRAEVAELLLAAGADPRSKDDAGLSPLHIAGTSVWPSASARAATRRVFRDLLPGRRRALAALGAVVAGSGLAPELGAEVLALRCVLGGRRHAGLAREYAQQLQQRSSSSNCSSSSRARRPRSGAEDTAPERVRRRRAP
jgi:hypothetical protein